jgi:NAD(P)H-flavin reductase
MMNYIFENNVNVEVVLLYSARYREDLIFYEDIMRMVSKQFRVKFFITDEPVEGDPNFSNERITIETLKSML